MTLKLPRRRFDSNGNVIVEWPEQDSAEARRYAIAYWQGILGATYPGGRPSCTGEARALAAASSR